MRVEYRTGQEVQAKHQGLWQIGVFIRENPNGSFAIKIGKQTVDLQFYDVKENRPAYQKEEGFAPKTQKRAI